MRTDFQVLAGEPFPLGVHVMGEMTVNFAAALHGKEECGVILYPKEGGGKIRLPFRKENQVGNINCLKVQGLRPEKYEYNFYVGEEIVTDPYARAVHGNEHWGRKADPLLRGGIPEDTFDWEGDRPPMIPLKESILYQLHVRGFTRHPSSEVTGKGTFLGIIEKIPYLKALGVTAVELMPAYEFLELEREKRDHRGTAAFGRYLEKTQEETLPKLNYWGYKKGYYFCPKASYCSGKDPMREFKELVKALHQNGMELIMQFYFPREIKGAYISEVMRYWAFTYHVDGFRLQGERIPTTLLATDPMLSNTKLFYYDFSCEEIYDSEEVPEYKNLGVYRDDFMYAMRRFLKSDEDSLGEALWQLKKNPRQTGVVNYMTDSNGFTLADLVSYERKHNEANGEEDRDGNPYNVSWNCGCEGRTRKKNIRRLRARQMRNAVLLLMSAQGTPMIVAGDEFGNSQEGNNNPYCQDNAITWLNWGQTTKNEALLTFWKQAILLRREHPILHREETFTMLDYLACGCPDLSYHGEEAWKVNTDRLSRTAGLLYCEKYAGGEDFLYLAYNMHWEAHEMALPAPEKGMEWRKVLDTGMEVQETVLLGEVTETKVEPRSIQVLIGSRKRDTAEENETENKKRKQRSET